MSDDSGAGDMARLRFTAVFQWKPSRRFLTVFQPGDYTVTRACADLAIAAGAAVEIAPPRRAPEPAAADLSDPLPPNP